MDLTQETFARAFRSLGTLEDPARFPHWLMVIAGNVCRTHGKKEQRRRALVEALALETQALDTEQARPADALDALGREARIAVVQRALADITDDTVRKIATLRYTEPEHTTQAIADKLGIPPGTVTVKLMRFRAAIRRDLMRHLLAVDTALEEKRP